MKKLLLASTALVAFAGVAAAEVKVTGSAEMGIFGGGADVINGSGGETQFYQDVEVFFNMSGSTDSGLEFGANIDLDEGNVTVTDDSGTSVYIRGSFGNLTMGDTDGAVDWAVTETVGNPGSIDDSETLHAGYMGAFGDGAYDGQVLRYDNTFGDLGFAISVEQDGAGVQDTGYAVGVKYGIDLGGTTVNLGAGYQALNPTSDWLPGNLEDYGIGLAPAGTDIDLWAISANASFGGGFSAGIAYSSWDFGGDDVTHTQLSVGYESGPIAVGVNYGVFDIDGVGDAAGYGIAAAYDLGGGASIHAAYGDSDIDGVVGDFSSFSLGVAMSF